MNLPLNTDSLSPQTMRVIRKQLCKELDAHDKAQKALRGKPDPEGRRLALQRVEGDIVTAVSRLNVAIGG